MSYRPSIAVCVMVRDCAEHLRRCLASLCGQVDAIYVTDTGSTDQTVEVARSVGAAIRSFAWCDDFSAARNASLTGITEDWILVLDADDAFEPGSLNGLRDRLTPDACAATLLYSIAPTHTPLRATRLIRNGLGCRYEGIIHESIGEWLRARRGEGWVRLDLPVTLVHHGYTADQVPAKVSRNLPLLRREWARLQSTGSAASRFHAGAELGMALARSGKPGEAAELLDAVWVQAVAAIPVRVPSVMKLLSCRLWLLEANGCSEDRLELVRGIEAACGEVPAYQLQRGLIELDCGRTAEALLWLNRFRISSAAPEFDVPFPVEYLGVRLWELLGRCHMALKQYGAAAARYRRCMELAPGAEEYPLRFRVAQSFELRCA